MRYGGKKSLTGRLVPLLLATTAAALVLSACGSSGNSASTTTSAAAAQRRDQQGERCGDRRRDRLGRVQPGSGAGG